MNSSTEMSAGFRFLAPTALVAISMLLGACGHSSGPAGPPSSGGAIGGLTGGTTGGTTGDSTTPDVYIGFDAGGTGSVDTFAIDLHKLRSFDTGLDAGIATVGADLLAVGTLNGVGTLRRLANFGTRTDTAYDPTVDSQYQFPAFVAPTTVVVGGLTNNVFFVSDASTPTSGEDTTTIPSLHTLSNLIATQPPELTYTIPVSVAGGRTWKVAYDTTSDRLFAAMTNGTVDVYDTFLTRAVLASKLGPAVTPSRTITPGSVPANGVSTKISTNLHGIAYYKGGDQLILSDIGSESDNSDGRLYVIDSASTASDTASGGGAAIVVPSKIISGSNTRLGNPVDVVLRADNSTVYVAEKGNSLILIYSDFFSIAGGDTAATYTVPTSYIGASGSPLTITPVQGR